MPSRHSLALKKLLALHKQSKQEVNRQLKEQGRKSLSQLAMEEKLLQKKAILETFLNTKGKPFTAAAKRPLDYLERQIFSDYLTKKMKTEVKIEKHNKRIFSLGPTVKYLSKYNSVNADLLKYLISLKLIKSTTGITSSAEGLSRHFINFNIDQLISELQTPAVHKAIRSRPDNSFRKRNIFKKRETMLSRWPFVTERKR